MKAVSKLALIISLGVLPAFASAKTNEDAYLETCRKEPGVPVPVAVVAPSLGSGYSGATVELEFTVDTKGKPGAFSVKSATDDVVATAVVDAVKQWRFKPAEADGVPVATKVLLPVKFVDSWSVSGRFAAN